MRILIILLLLVLVYFLVKEMKNGNVINLTATGNIEQKNENKKEKTE